MPWIPCSWLKLMELRWKIPALGVELGPIKDSLSTGRLRMGEARRLEKRGCVIEG